MSFPSAHKHSVISSIKKKYISPTEPSSYYLISLPLFISKVHERIICLAYTSSRILSPPMRIWTSLLHWKHSWDVAMDPQLAKRRAQPKASFHSAFHQHLTSCLLPSCSNAFFTWFPRKHSLFSSHVMGQYILVAFVDVSSSSKPLHTGVLQGSILSPLSSSLLHWLTHESFNQSPWFQVNFKWFPHLFLSPDFSPRPSIYIYKCLLHISSWMSTRYLKCNIFKNKFFGLPSHSRTSLPCSLHVSKWGSQPPTCPAIKHKSHPWLQISLLALPHSPPKVCSASSNQSSFKSLSFTTLPSWS